MVQRRASHAKVGRNGVVRVVRRSVLRLAPVIVVLGLASARAAAQSPDLPIVDNHGNFRRIDDQPIGRQRIQQLCGVPGLATTSQLAAVEHRRADSATAQKSSDAWYQLACARALLFARGARAREGLLMPIAASWARGSTAALEQAMAMLGDHSLPSRLLGILALEALPGDGLGERVGPDLVVTAEKFSAPIAVGVRDSVTDPYFLRGCVAVGLHLADRSTAETCGYRALAAGHDSTWHFLRLAWIAFRAKQLPLGGNLFELAVTTAHDSATRAELGWHMFGRNVGHWNQVQYMQSWQRMAPEEVTALFTLPDSSLLGWVRQRNRELDAITGNYGDRVARHFLTLIPSRSAFNTCLPVASGRTCYFYGQLRFDLQALPADAALFRMIDPRSHAPLLLVPITAKPGKASALDALPAMTAEVSIWSAATNRWSSRITTVKGGSPVSTVVGLPDPGGPLAWRVNAVGGNDHFATLRGESTALSAPFGISDPVLGTEGSGLSWDVAGRTVWLSSSLRFDRKRPIELYLQMWRDSIVPEVRVELTMRDAEEKAAPPKLQVGFVEPLKTPFSELVRTLDFSRLAKGRYRLGLRVSSQAGMKLAEREIVIELY